MQNQREEQTLKNALQGDIYAFQELFALFQAQLKSYLYRLVASRNDAEDLAHDTFLRAYSKLHLFRGDSSLKTWVFQIATNLAYTHLQHRKRWTLDVLEQAKALVGSNPEMVEEIMLVATTSTEATYDIQEHIDTCFTCMAKTLPIENQVALLLKDVYDFSVNEIGIILEKSEGVVKYLLQSARQTMTDIFEQRCALINKTGVCHQCSELNGWFNPKQDQQEALMKLDLVKGSKKYNRDELYAMRTALVKSIDPLHGSGHELQEILLKCNRMAMGELVTLG
jgi:RNA polymerase sigma-70 factor (ECF subfamily)